ncbi:MAG TPA: serine hydrolase [Candidatus Acidoferrales bacterium]|nr:serine hydrolase [Candidatus Acidoferrales bacterium]
MRKSLLFVLLFCSVVNAQTTSPTKGEVPGVALHTRELLWTKMNQEILRTEQGFDGVLGVVVRDLTDGREIAINADEVFPTASCIKLALLTELYRQSQTGSGARLTDTYILDERDLVPDSYVMQNLTPNVSRVTNRDLATFVVAVSDNAATNLLIDRVGMENVNRMLNSADLHETRLRRKMMDAEAAKAGRENVSTAREMALLMEDIYRARILDRQSSDDLLRLLSTPKDSWIPRLLPDVKIANKPGALDGVRNDVGIVLLKNHPYVICVFSTYAHDEHAAENVISQISLLAYKYFSQVENASAYGRTLAP